MTFIDTNVLVYAADDSDPSKFERACGIVFSAVADKGFLISAQVLNEFTSVAYRKLRKTDAEVRELLTLLEQIRSVPVLPSWTRRAVEIKAQYGLQFYDSLLIAAAEEYHCDTIFSEDLNDGQTYAGVKAVNPFKEGDMWPKKVIAAAEAGLANRASQAERK